MLYTRKGDDGRSGLFGTTERFPKNSLVYEALGALDELNSLLGVCKAQAKRSALRGALDIAPIIARVQEIIFIAQAEIAGAPKKVTQTHVDELEAAIGTIERQIENPHSFVIPGASELSAQFDYARAVSRRAERRVVGASADRSVSPATNAYLNRLSSLLYALARYTAAQEGAAEHAPAD